MRIRLIGVIVIFYIAASSLLVPLFSGMGYNLLINSEQRIMTTKSAGFSEQKIQYKTNKDFATEYISDFSNRIKDFILGMNERRLVELAVTMVVVLLGAYAVSASYNRQYLNLCSRIDDIKSGDYSVKLIKGGFYPEIAGKLKELLSVLDREKQKREESIIERDRVIDNAVEQFQMVMSNAKGKMKVIIEAGVLEKGSQEITMLESSFESMREMENIIESLRKS